jgi:hypothetical protein
MKEQKWDDSYENSKEFLEATTILLDEDDDDDDESLKETAFSAKARVTELRRRIEERMDSKRIDLEFDYEELDDAIENFQ